MNKFLQTICILFFVFSFSQEKEREVLRGKIISDSMEVENITVLNVSTQIGAISDVDGYFSIKARAKDTLVFQGLAYVSQKYILTESDFLVDNFKIKLDVKVNELDEVVVTPNSLTGILEVDTEKINVYGLNMAGIDISKLAPDDVRNSKSINPAVDSNFSSLRGINFGLLLDMFTSKERKERKKQERIEKHEKEQWQREVMAKSFYEHLMNRYSHNFFITNLNVNNQEIISFVSFAEPNDFSLMAEMLKYENEIQLVEYLVKKSEEFNRNKKRKKDTNTNDDK